MSRMNKVQENLFKLVCEIDDICTKYDIKYYLAGGTALGTVRNHRFLPWDDDIDLYITKDNWNKLRNVLETEYDVVPEGRAFVYNENTKYYNNPIVRYVDNTTTAIYKSQALPGKACGQHIEFLIMDPLPTDEEEIKKYVKLLRVYTELMSPYFVVNKNLSLDEWQEHYALYDEYCHRVDSEGEEKVIKELEDYLQQFSTEDCDTFCMRWGIQILMYKKEYYGNGRLESFEGRLLPVAEIAEGIFRIAYGDSWMYVPDYEEQVVHNAFQDIEIPFSEYTDRYINKIDRDSVFEKYKRNKRSNASVFYNRRKIDSLLAREKVLVCSKHISNNLDEKEDYLRNLQENKDYDSVFKEFNEYISLQLTSDVRKYGIWVPISDKNLATLLFSYIEQGKYFNANKFLNIRKMQENSLSDELVEIDKIINICRDLSIARYDKKDVYLVQSLIDDYCVEYPYLLDIYRSRLWIMENNAKSKDDYESIDKLCHEILEIYPFDGEVMAIQAKAKLECGLNKEAMNLYQKAVYNTRNGLIWQKVEDESGISRIDLERDFIEELNNEN